MILVYDILGYKMMIDKLKIEDDKLNQELEDSHGDPNRMSMGTLEKRINLYKQFLKQDDLSDLDRISLKIFFPNTQSGSSTEWRLNKSPYGDWILLIGEALL